MATIAKTSSTPETAKKKKRKSSRAKTVRGKAAASSRKKTGKSKKRGSTKIVKIAWSKVDWRDYGPCVIGVDEVGRGCLAGPVFASAVLFTHDGLIEEVTDSKLLTREERETLSLKIHDVHPVEIAQASVEEIDEINILWASMLAMKRAIEALEARMAQTEWAAHVGQVRIVVDGRTRIPGLAFERQIPLVKGDLRCAPVSAASIAAKVARDRHMMAEAARFPQYGFELHKGYGTPVHQAALATHGPCELHRRTFAGVKELLVREPDTITLSVPSGI